MSTRDDPGRNHHDATLASEHHLLLGGAGFLGRNLTQVLLDRGASVTVVDNLVTGRLDNAYAFRNRVRYSFIYGDGAHTLRGDKRPTQAVDVVWQLAALASPAHYFNRPVETAWAGSEVHRAALEFAAEHVARVVYFSSSEMYGNPEVHPQPETYLGRLDPWSPRAPYDLSKAYGEMLCEVFLKKYGLDIRVVRLFNVYGPHMAIGDGRMIPAFLSAAIRGQALPLHGSGDQKRSMSYVDDVMNGLLRLASIDRGLIPWPPVFNIGNPDERTVREVAEACWHAVHGPDVAPKFLTLPTNPGDPTRRCPDIKKAVEILGWAPSTPLEEGLRRTATWMADAMSSTHGKNLGT